MALFKKPSVGDKVILTVNGEDKAQRIVEVTPRSIKVSSCNLYRFNRNGELNKTDTTGANRKIRPIDSLG